MDMAVLYVQVNPSSARTQAQERTKPACKMWGSGSAWGEGPEAPALSLCLWQDPGAAELLGGWG